MPVNKRFVIVIVKYDWQNFSSFSCSAYRKARGPSCKYHTYHLVRACVRVSACVCVRVSECVRVREGVRAWACE
jgi:hypothetical protein